MMSEPLDVAKGVLIATIESLEVDAACLFCDAGHIVDDDGGDHLHDEACPLHGYDMTVDVERLKEWARSTHAPARGGR